MSETKTNEPVKQEGDFKIKKKRVPKKLTVPEETVKIDLAAQKKAAEPIKVDLTKTEEKDAVQKQETESSVLREEGSEVGLQEVGQTHEGTAENVIEEIPVTEEEKEKETKEKPEPIKKVEAPVKQLPENVEKLVSFMEETGGTVEDYVRLNADYENIDNEALLREYYKNRHYNEGNILINSVSMVYFSCNVSGLTFNQYVRICKISNVLVEKQVELPDSVYTAANESVHQNLYEKLSYKIC